MIAPELNANQRPPRHPQYSLIDDRDCVIYASQSAKEFVQGTAQYFAHVEQQSTPAERKPLVYYQDTNIGLAEQTRQGPRFDLTPLLGEEKSQLAYDLSEELKQEVEQAKHVQPKPGDGISYQWTIDQKEREANMGLNEYFQEQYHSENHIQQTRMTPKNRRKDSQVSFADSEQEVSESLSSLVQDSQKNAPKKRGRPKKTNRKKTKS